MLLADSRLPSGAHVCSNTLEAALRAGMPPSDVPRYLQTRMRTVTRVEAGTAVVARALVRSASDPDEVPDALRTVDAAWAARTPSRALREIGRSLGAGLTRLARSVWPESGPLAVMPSRGLARPVVLGAIAGATGLGAVELARLVAYDDAQTVAAATLKLEPLEPALASRWVLDACARFEPFVERIAPLDDPAAIPAAGAPQIEGWAEAHASTTRRLFRA
ncbi:urease accessory protein UreF [Pseudoclavibacter chungangensis]|uniref:Urease accessory protein UreF n=2 Tax=Pseudoclavibacter chungangensis TaxID=587635 RepID=A0A7J5BPF1_9MICO|nr:urease accessory UreF family protein [Pseudoclavibacter chungangensis]KAB1654579.1 urease accessory protein UreF [Pseudoclavibacter chungangensis]